MSFEDDTQPDLRWLAQRCRSLYPALAPLTGMTLAALVGRGHVHEGAIGALFEELGLRPAVWGFTLTQQQVPVVAHVSGLGWGVIAGVASKGVWRFESVQGTRLVDAADLGGGKKDIFASILPKLAEAKASRTTAKSVFRSAMVQGLPLFGVAAIAALCANLLALAGSLYSMQVYDRVIPTQGISTLIVLTVGTLLAGLIELVIKLVRSHLLEAAMKRIDLSVSQEIFERVTRIRMDQFPRSVGSLSAQLRSYEAIRACLASVTMFAAADAPFALLFLLVIFAVGGAELAVIPLCFAVLALLVGLFYRRRIAVHAARGISTSNRKFGLLVETVDNAECIKAYGGRWRQAALWRTLNTATVEEEARVRHHSEHATYIAGFIQQASYVAIVCAGAYVASSSGRMTIGALIACSILSGRVLTPVASLPGLLVQWAHARASLDNLEKVFALELDNHDVEHPLAPERIYGAYELTDLHFTYPGRSDTLNIRQFSVRPGEKVAVIGPTGAGKTTLLKILAGLYRAQAGRVLLDGLEIQQIDRDLLSDRVGLLPQHAKLFAGTLRENLVLGLGMISDAQILETCRRTGVAEFVSRHPKGLDLPIAEGGEGLSGGQKQQVALTRLVLARPDVWLLDEPTASMDEQTEARCLAALRESISAQQTLVLVTHKPSLLSLVDRVVILGERGVVVDGTKAVVAQKLQQLIAGAAEVSDQFQKREGVGMST